MACVSNTLGQEKSLYLRQHAKNPVHWQPWTKAAFEIAEQQNKPVLISIGYAACHWCHVMERESFEDPYIADLMNKHFICIKVDREEHPEVDQIYMEAVMMINQHGGWPLNVFCMPDGRPFFGGTYFPSEDKGHGIVPWPQLLMRIADHYKRNKHELEENADNILKNMMIANTPVKGDEQVSLKETLIQAAQFILKTYDSEWGGFTQAPKFPPVKVIEFLLAIQQTEAAENIYNFTSKLEQASDNTLQHMACGGLFDQVGGGFYRYSVDQAWTIPHFEKMLYDNAGLIDIYAKAYMRFQDPLFKATVYETIAWLDREMQTPEGLYAASLDADSEEGEGHYYVWTPDEIITALGETDGKAFCKTYGVTEEGNFEDQKTHLRLLLNAKDKRPQLEASRQTLLAIRGKRTPPARDDKQLVAWNSLLATGLMHAGFAFNEIQWIDKAKQLLDNIWSLARDAEGRLAAVLYQGQPEHDGNLIDYAYTLQACLAVASLIDGYYPGESPLYQERAESLLSVIMEDFKDSHLKGFYFTSQKNDTLITRKKEWWDNAIPAANAVLMESLSKLYALTGNQQYRDTFHELLSVYGPLIDQAPGGAASAALALTHDLIGMTVLTVKSTQELQQINDGLRTRPYRPIVMRIDENLAKPFQLCVGNQCIHESQIDSVLDKVAG